MKFRIFYQTGALEAIAKGEIPPSWGTRLCFEGTYYYDNPENLFLAAEGELADILPGAAVELAATALRAEAAVFAKQYEDRLANLLAITYEVTE